jgi:hypothetical protein
VAEGVRTDAREPRQLGRVHRADCGNCGTHVIILKGGTGSRVKRLVQAAIVPPRFRVDTTFGPRAMTRWKFKSIWPRCRLLLWRHSTKFGLPSGGREIKPTLRAAMYGRS